MPSRASFRPRARYRETDRSWCARSWAKSYFEAVPGMRWTGWLRSAPREGGRARDLRGEQLATYRDREFFRGLKLGGQRQAIADKIIKEIVNRLQFLDNVGLEPCRSTARQRRSPAAKRSGSDRLADPRACRCHVLLDEPSIVSPARQRSPANDAQHLRDLAMRDGCRTRYRCHSPADDVVDMGAGAGHGGQIVAQGTPEDIRHAAHSFTGQYLAGHDDYDPAIATSSTPRAV